MHRVELKGSPVGFITDYQVKLFLMHRVELKALERSLENAEIILFLMHRVELKEGERPCKRMVRHPVPNAPCGVER